MRSDATAALRITSTLIGKHPRPRRERAARLLSPDAPKTISVQ
jgi:hypothetical protein